MNCQGQAFQAIPAPTQGLNFSSKAFVPNSNETSGQTINNITINNFNKEQENDNKLYDKLFFPSLDSMKNKNPTKEQSDEMASVTQKVGGIRPLHHKKIITSKTDKKVELVEEFDVKSNEEGSTLSDKQK
jgi:hypothetical protein